MTWKKGNERKGNLHNWVELIYNMKLIKFYYCQRQSNNDCIFVGRWRTHDQCSLFYRPFFFFFWFNRKRLPLISISFSISFSPSFLCWSVFVFTKIFLSFHGRICFFFVYFVFIYFFLLNADFKGRSEICFLLVAFGWRAPNCRSHTADKSKRDKLTNE